MSSTRPLVPPTNLKERIAALEQRNAANGGGATTRPTSPTPSIASSVGGGTTQTAGALRDKIAKFERKGGVPVPRGSFGLGAPPTMNGGPRRQGELYGNRIPAPARAVSSSMSIASTSRAPSPTGSSMMGLDSPPGFSPPGDPRRSFSMSSVISDFSDLDSEGHLDYTPITSPTFAFPLDSPESVASVSYTPEASPSSLSTTGDAATFKYNIKRGTSFQKALEIARNAEHAKVEAGVGGIYMDNDAGLPVEEEVEDPTTPTQRQLSLDDKDPVVHAPAVEVSAEETVPAVLNDSPIEETPSPPPAVPEATAEELAPPTSMVDAKPNAIIPYPDLPPSEVIATTDASIAKLATPTLSELSAVLPPLTSSDPEPAVEIPLPAVHVTDEVIEERPLAAKIKTAVEISPLLIRKRTATPVQVAEVVKSVGVADEIKSEIAPAITDVVDKTLGVSAEPPAAIHISQKEEEVPAIVSPVPLRPTPSILLPAEVKDLPASALVIETPTIVIPPPDLPPPEIIVHNEPSAAERVEAQKTVEEASKSEEMAARKAALTLDADKFADESLMSPTMNTGNMSAMSYTDVLSNYFTGGNNRTGTFRTTTPPALPNGADRHVPQSPIATLAYDVPESPLPVARPRVKAPDPQSFLSPPPSGFMSAVPSSGGSSMGSFSSIGSRPMSMIETSPGHVSRALRMTPATSRGVPMFLPPNNSRPRKSDFVYFPPTPDEEETALEEAEAEFGVMTIGHRRRGSEPDLKNANGSTSASGGQGFRAVVHGRVRETPASATMPSSGHRPRPLPETPQIKRTKRASVLEPPLSPGQGELAALLQEAMWLEDTLNKGELPSEVVHPTEEEKRLDKEKADAVVKAKADDVARLKEEERQRIAYATAQLQAKRDQPTPGRLKHTFLIPLAKARSVQSSHKKEVSTSQAERFPHKQEEDLLRPKSAGVSEQSHTTKMLRPKTPDTHAQEAASWQKAKQQRPKTPEPSASATLDTSKSPKSSRFASLKRLGSISRSGPSQGHPTRNSNSTSSEISSEDSTVAVTPPDNKLEFGAREEPASTLGEFGYMQGQDQLSNSSATSFPSLSPKKSTSTMGRATSFAEKMWSRTRTKSSGSNLSSASERTDHTEESVPRLPAFGPPPAINLPDMPSAPSVIPVSTPETRVINPPSRSTSLRHPMELPPVPNTSVPPLPTNSNHSQLSEGDSLLLPESQSSTRPSSWTSVSSAGSLPSPLFDKALFDAFPSVPGSTMAPATTIGHNFPHRRDISLTATAATATADFDSALLSSAIHLASAHRSTANNAVPASAATTGMPTSTSNLTSKKSARRLTMHASASRRSGERAR